MQGGEGDVSPIAIYTSEDNTISLDVKLENETVWLSQAQMSLLFDTDRTSILRHINNVYKIGNWTENQLVQKLHRFEKKENATLHVKCYTTTSI